MLFTEEEARTMACCKSAMFETRTPEGGVNFISPNCIGAPCMAWRWEPAVCEAPSGKIIEPTRGYCGLAGKVGL